MIIEGALQPDQQAHLWDHHVSVYERVFEPVTLRWAVKAIEALGLKPGSRIIDSGAGAGGAALELARRRARVTAIDASTGMVARMLERAAAEGLRIDALAMDGQHLAFADASFDAALSVFGVILYPDAEAGTAELRRVTKPGGRVALVTWTEPQDYELASELRAAATSLIGQLPGGALPAQLRFTDRGRFQALFEAAGLERIEIDTVAASLAAPSAQWLSDRVAFAPGMAAMLAGLGERATDVLQAFRARLEMRFGEGPLELQAKAFIGVAQKPA
jgi:ubiquinone/menaquinone biosynthesis C-methylase UbiE